MNDTRGRAQPTNERRGCDDARDTVRYQNGGTIKGGSCCGGEPPDVPVQYDLRIVRGATWTLGVQAVDSRGCVIEMPENGVLRLAISPCHAEPIVKEFGAADQEDDGYITMSLLPRETWSMPEGKHPYSAVLLFSSFERVPALCGTAEVYSCGMPEPPAPDDTE